MLSLRNKNVCKLLFASTNTNETKTYTPFHVVFLTFQKCRAFYFYVILCYYFKSMRQSGSDQCWQYPLENRHMKKFKPGLQKAELLIKLLSKVFFISDTVQGEFRLMCSRVQVAWLTTIERKERGWKAVEREADTYPWQCFLFVEGVLGFYGRLSGAVGEKCTTCNTKIKVRTTLTHKLCTQCKMTQPFARNIS